MSDFGLFGIRPLGRRSLWIPRVINCSCTLAHYAANCKRQNWPLEIFWQITRFAAVAKPPFASRLNDVEVSRLLSADRGFGAAGDAAGRRGFVGVELGPDGQMVGDAECAFDRLGGRLIVERQIVE